MHGYPQFFLIPRAFTEFCFLCIVLNHPKNAGDGGSSLCFPIDMQVGTIKYVLHYMTSVDLNQLSPGLINIITIKL